MNSLKEVTLLGLYVVAMLGNIVTAFGWVRWPIMDTLFVGLGII